MRYRCLGRTGLSVSEIGFGAWGIGGQMWRGSQDHESLRSLHAAADEGINFFDTALVYGNGRSERLIGQFLRESESGSDLKVATKIPPKNHRWPATGRLEEVFPAAHIVECAEESLRNLGLDCLDLIQLHVWSPDWLGNEDWFAAFSRLREQGKVRYLGVSVNDHQPDSAIDLVKSGKVDTVQVIYNIFDQSASRGLFDACRLHEVGVIARVPFDEGALTGTITPETTFPKKDWRRFYFREDRKMQVFERVQAIASDVGIESESLPELALRFCIAPPVVSTAIPGMRRREHVRSNAAASSAGTPPPEVLEKLEAHAWDKNFYA